MLGRLPVSAKKNARRHKGRYVAICVPMSILQVGPHIAIYRSLRRRAFFFADTGMGVSIWLVSSVSVMKGGAGVLVYYLNIL